MDMTRSLARFVLDPETPGELQLPLLVAMGLRGKQGEGRALEEVIDILVTVHAQCSADFLANLLNELRDTYKLACAVSILGDFVDEPMTGQMEVPRWNKQALQALQKAQKITNTTMNTLLDNMTIASSLLQKP
jgi:hypothetical protein